VVRVAKLTAKQQVFVDEYLADLNATQAAQSELAIVQKTLTKLVLSY